jgi:thioredoxin 1
MAKGTQSKATGKARKSTKVGRRKGTGKVLAATDEDFDRNVAAAGGPVLVDLWATWCGPCLALSPVLDELAVEFADRLTVIKVDIDQSPEIADRFRVLTIPRLLLITGTRKRSKVGSLRKAELSKWIRGAIGAIR